MTTTLTADVPVMGPAYDPARPETKQAWLDFRRGGITATDVRDWGQGSKKRLILEEKVSGQESRAGSSPIGNTGLTLDDYARHGTRREPVIAEWMANNFGITPCDNAYARRDNPRHIASPDGISLDPFTGGLVVGEAGADIAEIKTSAHDLTPGRIVNDVLVEIDPEGYFAKANYYSQILWTMYVMNATRALFIHERHDGQINPETGIFTPVASPVAVWIERDDKLIDVLVEKVATRALTEIDAARLMFSLGELPPASDVPAEHAVLMADYLTALDNEKVAAAAKKQAWDKLLALYQGADQPDRTVDAGFARLTVSTSTAQKSMVDMDAARAKAPKLVTQYDALIARYTSIVETTTRKTTITRSKGVMR